MKTFEFRLDPLLKYRKNRRDLCRQVLARALAGERDLLLQKDALVDNRISQLTELRNLSVRGPVDIDRAASRRYFAGQLLQDMAELDRNRDLVAKQVAMCRQLVADADRDVKVLEKLREKREQEFRFEHQRREGYELEDTWAASNALEAR